MTTSEITVNTSGDVPLKLEQQENFAQLFISETEFFGNGTQAYIEAYNVDTSKPNFYRAAQSNASRLLRNSIVLARVNFLLENKLGLNDHFVDKQLAFLITQSGDMRTKLAAIREYNALKGRIKTKIEHSFTETTDSELDAELELVEEELAHAAAILEARKGKTQPTNGMPQLTDVQEEAIQSQQVI